MNKQHVAGWQWGRMRKTACCPLVGRHRGLFLVGGPGLQPITGRGVGTNLPISTVQWHIQSAYLIGGQKKHKTEQHGTTTK